MRSQGILVAYVNGILIQGALGYSFLSSDLPQNVQRHTLSSVFTAVAMALSGNRLAWPYDS